jgi:hypothetical protein
VFFNTLASANRRVTNPHAWLLLLAAVTALPAVPHPAAATAAGGFAVRRRQQR